MPVECGSVPPHNAHAPAPASPPPAPPAVPPARITSMAVSAASGCDVATIAFWAWTVERPAKWKFLIARAFLISVYLDIPHGGVGRAYRRLFTRGSWHIRPRQGNGG